LVRLIALNFVFGLRLVNLLFVASLLIADPFAHRIVLSSSLQLNERVKLLQVQTVQLILFKQDFDGPLQKANLMNQQFNVQLPHHFLLTLVVLHHLEPIFAQPKKAKE
jgi:hypothetical protein